MNNNTEQTQTLDERYRSVVIVWAAVFFSHFSFLFIVYMAKPEAFSYISGAPLGGNVPVLIAIFAASALLLFALSFIVKRFIFAKALSSGSMEMVQTGILVAVCMAEMISILGMLLAFSLSYQYFFFWFVLGIVGSMLHFPRKTPFEMAAQYKRIGGDN